MTDKHPCKECGAMILPMTSEETGGLCIPCKKGYRKNLEASKKHNKKQMEDDPFWVAWQSISSKKAAQGFSSLTTMEKYFYSMNHLKATVLRGGFHTYFDMAPLEEVEVAKRAFLENDAPIISNLIKRAETILFPHGIPEIFKDQLSELPCWTEEEIEKDIDPQWSKDIDKLNNEFYSVSDTVSDIIDKYFKDKIGKK